MIRLPGCSWADGLSDTFEVKEQAMKRYPGFPGRCHDRIRSMLVYAVVVAAAIGIGGHPAHAQEATFGSKWEALVTPYMWISFVDVGINPSNGRLPSASGTIGFDQLVEHLSWVPFMGAAEFRNGPIGIAFDYLHAPVRTGINTRNILFGGGTNGSTADVGNITFLYRAIADPNQNLDIGAGVRVWGFKSSLSLNEGLLPAVNITNGGSWADPLIAARYHRELGNGFGATVYGDVGGFGLGADLDWQVIGTVDYAFKPGIDLHAGFRSLNFNQTVPRAGIDVNMYGPIIAATFRF
jgi:hypothetical protein